MLEFSAFLFAEADQFKDRTLNEEDVSNVVCEIFEVQAKSYTFGRVLRLPKVAVDSIHRQHSDPQECLFRVLDEFVKQVEPPPTWRVIVEALKNPLIGFHRLSHKIKRKHCPLTHQQDGIIILMPFTIDMKVFFYLQRSVYSQDKPLKTLLLQSLHSPYPHLSQSMV